jgi:hypothetical protein
MYGNTCRNLIINIINTVDVNDFLWLSHFVLILQVCSDLQLAH